MPNPQIDVYYTSSPVFAFARFLRTNPFVNLTARKFAWAIAQGSGRTGHQPIVFHVATSRQLPADETLEQAGVKENDVLLVLDLPSGTSPSSIVDSKMPSRIEGELPPAIRSKAQQGGFTLDELEEAREKQKPAVMNNPWVSGSFYLVAFLSATILLLVAGQMLSFYVFPLVLVGGLLALTLIGALQLKSDEKLRDESFIALMELTFRQLPLLRLFLSKAQKSEP